MKTAPLTELESRAADALRALLGRISILRLKEVTCVPRHRSRVVKFVAHVEVLGHSHTLACGVNALENSSHLRAALRNLHDTAADFAADATPIFIAPRLSPEAQAICRESSASFLDLEGNARLFLGESFIMMRSRPGPRADRPAASPQQAAAYSAPPRDRRPLTASREQLAFIA